MPRASAGLRSIVVASMIGLLPLAGCGSDPVGPFADTDFVMVFVSARDGNDELYGVDSEGGVDNLTEHTADDRAPVWSPDGGRIAFTRQRGPEREVFVLDLRTGATISVSASPNSDDFSPSWHPDGTRLAFTSDRDGDLDVYSVRADGGALVNLTDHPGPDRDPVWSPDGDRIAFASGRSLRAAIYVMNADGSGAERVTEGMVADDVAPRWHPTDDRIVFESNRDGASEIVVVSLATREEQVLASDPAHDVGARWSPDGSRVLFLSNRSDALWDVWAVDGDGANVVRMTDFLDDREAGPAWSPDGTEIAFESRQAGNWDVFVTAVDGSSVRAVTTDAANDGSATWRPPGS